MYFSRDLQSCLPYEDFITWKTFGLMVLPKTLKWQKHFYMLQIFKRIFNVSSLLKLIFNKRPLNEDWLGLFKGLPQPYFQEYHPFGWRRNRNLLFTQLSTAERKFSPLALFPFIRRLMDELLPSFFFFLSFTTETADECNARLKISDEN